MTGLERIPAPDWYAEMAGPPFAPLSTSWEHGLAVRALARLGPVGRGLAVGILARRGPGAVLIKGAKGTTAALVAAALPPRRRRIVLIEFLRRPLPRNPAKRVLYRLWWGLVERTLVRRAMAGAQVMTSWEREATPSTTGFPMNAFA